MMETGSSRATVIKFLRDNYEYNKMVERKSHKYEFIGESESDVNFYLWFVEWVNRNDSYHRNAHKIKAKARIKSREKQEYRKFIQKRWYDRHKDDPEFKKKNSERTREYVRKVQGTEIHKLKAKIRRKRYKSTEKYKEQSRKRYHERRNDPDFVERVRDYANKLYHSRKNDPDFIAKRREYAKKRKKRLQKYQQI